MAWDHSQWYSFDDMVVMGVNIRYGKEYWGLLQMQWFAIRWIKSANQMMCVVYSDLAFLLSWRRGLHSSASSSFVVVLMRRMTSWVGGSLKRISLSLCISGEYTWHRTFKTLMVWPQPNTVFVDQPCLCGMHPEVEVLKHPNPSICFISTPLPATTVNHHDDQQVTTT